MCWCGTGNPTSPTIYQFTRLISNGAQNREGWSRCAPLLLITCFFLSEGLSSNFSLAEPSAIICPESVTREGIHSSPQWAGRLLPLSLMMLLLLEVVVVMVLVEWALGDADGYLPRSLLPHLCDPDR